MPNPYPYLDKHRDLIAREFPCPVCSGTGEIIQRGEMIPGKVYQGFGPIDTIPCPICARGRPDLIAAGIKWLGDQGWFLDNGKRGETDNQSERHTFYLRFIRQDPDDLLVWDYDNPISSSKIYPTDMSEPDKMKAALLDVIEQVQEKEEKCITE